MSVCDHEGWGIYRGEEGPCPPPTEMREVEGGVECPTCLHHICVVPLTRVFAINRETATLARETR